MLVIASPTAILAEAIALIMAKGAFSPTEKASPLFEIKSDLVIATSLTGTCQGPTN